MARTTTIAGYLFEWLRQMGIISLRGVRVDYSRRIGARRCKQTECCQNTMQGHQECSSSGNPARTQKICGFHLLRNTKYRRIKSKKASTRSSK